MYRSGLQLFVTSSPVVFFCFWVFFPQTQNIMWLYTVAEHSADRNISIYNAYIFHGRVRYFITDTLFQCVAII